MTTNNDNQNSMKRDREGRFINEHIKSHAHVRLTPTEQWKFYAHAANEVGKNTMHLLEAKHGKETLLETEGLLSVLGFMNRLNVSSMVNAREARVANMINIATHKEYFNKSTVARAYLEIEDYIESGDDAIVPVNSGAIEWAKLISDSQDEKFNSKD